ncbi:abc-2 type transporter : Transport permease protein OS=Candidatus Acetothermus autotrophicum GN=HGMM_OP2C039 PE=3 SV=1: ABC2_membrane [Gemmataceae bacterium]|nr:abc-2 type transporter : Transport permease protein OS=Candidatus Acetothermus autotrophicum GN=HGMM_OP2C039 PE=3 SV=1: ABC2_membrane [Gemmataceae bacterium]VTU00808.1 abc-2 type transporter : Transport permease protein OS=Candidatus Acetothermus autotrophicum GN=HGMM_OP2C039 PE=3 SV=1: ABC2_membrane [Gemmataceae bacterium]
MLAHLRTLRLATWLGWQLETNWASPWLFALYMLVKPVCGSLMLVCMFYAARSVAGARVPVEFMPYLYVSNACYGLVGSVMFGLSYAVVRDREHYRMLKYVYISPAHFQTYFLGRGAARGLEAVVGGVLNVGVGLFLFSELRNTVTVDLPWLVLYLAIGGAMLWACGMLLAAACLNMSRNGMFLSEGVAGVVYLASGVVFPLSALPAWVQPVSLSLPTTYWLEGMRRALMGTGALPAQLRGPLADWSNGELAATLAATTAALVVLAQLFWRWSERRAWRNGKLEENAGV